MLLLLKCSKYAIMLCCMSKSIRLIRENDPSTYEQQIQLFGVLPDDASRKKVITTLESFDPEFYERQKITGEVPLTYMNGKTPEQVKQATHPSLKGFDLIVHTVAQLTGDEQPRTFITHDITDDTDNDDTRTKEMPYPFFFGEDDELLLANNPMYKGYLYGLNVLNRTRDIEILDKSKINSEYRFSAPEVIAHGAGGLLVAQCMDVDVENGAFNEYSNFYPTHYGQYAPTNLRSLTTFAVLSANEAQKYVGDVQLLSL